MFARGRIITPPAALLVFTYRTTVDLLASAVYTLLSQLCSVLCTQPAQTLPQHYSDCANGMDYNIFLINFNIALSLCSLDSTKIMIAINLTTFTKLCINTRLK